MIPSILPMVFASPWQERASRAGRLAASVFGRLAGYEDDNDGERLGFDPAMRWIVGGKAVSGFGRPRRAKWVASRRSGLPGLRTLLPFSDLPGHWIDRVHSRRPPKGIVLDMDSSVSPIFGEQEGSAYKGHFGCACYHPLFVFNQFGDLERCSLRPGNVHSADGWKGVLEPVVERHLGKVSRLYFRADAAFADPEVYEFLEAEGLCYAIRLPANSVLQERIGYLLKRPVGRPLTSSAGTTPALAIRRKAGRYHAAWWCRSNGTPASFIPASASSLPT
jgi:hypothetical protein